MYIWFAETSNVLLPTQVLTAFIEVTNFSNYWKSHHNYFSLSNEMWKPDCNYISWHSCKRLGLPAVGSWPNSNLNNYSLLPLFLSCGLEEHTALFCSFTLCMETSVPSCAGGDCLSMLENGSLPNPLSDCRVFEGVSEWKAEFKCKFSILTLRVSFSTCQLNVKWI